MVSLPPLRESATSLHLCNYFSSFPPSPYRPFLSRLSSLWLRPFANAVLIEVVATTAVVTAPVFTVVVFNIVVVIAEMPMMRVLSFQLILRDPSPPHTREEMLLAPVRKAT